MRFLIISDVHGNRFGLESVLAAAQDDYDVLLCLGDIVGYGAHPNECCRLLRERDAWCLSGNHDAAALGLIDIQWFNPVAEATILWTRRELSQDNRDWLRTLPAQRDLGSGGAGESKPGRSPDFPFEAVHGSLREPWEEYITGPATAEPTLLRMRHGLCFFGHTHVAICYRCPQEMGAWKRWDQLQEEPLPEGGGIALESGWKYLINPGSCGQPRDGNPQARYALFDTQERTVEIHPVDYDWEAARRAIIEAGLPRLLGDRLRAGR